MEFESSIGQEGEHVLRNVAKVERFVLDLLRQTLVDEREFTVSSGVFVSFFFIHFLFPFFPEYMGSMEYTVFFFFVRSGVSFLPYV